ncbi:ABC transporter ATP-binding protein [Ureibacillus sinduriensis]|uniref:Antibiotic ABC transporter ATP-binding protein n=1 Tax=Ureibacillus sinduriensis BLB-1 = JCM 15800 TaxID=1384057 RepID=A0A0A3HW66_9BACL|nr:ABC transporter ATP-binding protein [Ureibacillus sinduriensis]KGR74588.1 antibiotic ABC transporter ATP-binding protein [Ureibacillus sinduriensis BLB-1 = JCM 15800]
MIEVVNLSKNFKRVTAVEQVNLYIEPGEIVGLLGPNGAGKSTTIAMLSTLISPTDGDVLLNHKSILKNPSELRGVLGVVPQEIALYEDLTAKENLQFFGSIQKMPKQLLAERIDIVLEQIGLQDEPKKLVKHYSGGMKRRLNIGVAMLHEPKYLIMDEPTVGIDPQSRNHILKTVKTLNENSNMAIIYTSHYMEEVEFLCNRIYIMDKGKIIASGTKEEIKAVLSSENTVHVKLEFHSKSFINDLMDQPMLSNINAKEAEITFTVAKGMDFLPMLLSLCEKNNVILKSFQVEEPTLEDVFLHLTGRALRN